MSNSNKNYFNDLILLFKIRADPHHYNLESTANENFLKIPQLDKQKISFLEEKTKNLSDVSNALKEANFIYRFDEDFVTKFPEIEFNEYNFITFLFQIIAFIFVDIRKPSVDFYCSVLDPINLCIINNPKISQKYHAQINSIFMTLFTYTFKAVGFQPSEKYIKTTYYHFQKNTYLPSAFYCELIDFVSFIMELKNDSHNFELLILSLQENRPIMRGVSNHVTLLKIIEPYCENFDLFSLTVLSLVSTRNVSIITKNEVKYIVTKFPPKIIKNFSSEKVEENDRQNEVPIFQTHKIEVKPFDYRIIEGKSDFSNGLIMKLINSPKYNGLTSEHFALLPEENLSPLKALSTSFKFMSIDVLTEFFTKFSKDLYEIKDKNNFIPCYVSMIYLLFDFWDKEEIITPIKKMVFNDVIFNTNQTLFGPYLINDEISKIRTFTVKAFKNSSELIELIKCNKENPFFVADIFLRLEKLDSFYNNDFLRIISDCCAKLQLLDLKEHCQHIESARHIMLILLGDIFLNTYDSYKYFEYFMKFCYEKQLSKIIIWLFKKSTTYQKDCGNLTHVFNFILKTLRVNTDMCWELIKATSKIFEKRPYLKNSILDFLDITIDFLNEVQTKEVLDLIFKYSEEVNELQIERIKTLSDSINKIDPNESFDKLCIILGQKCNTKSTVRQVNFFIINPYVIQIILLTYGFTNDVIDLFYGLASCSLTNILYFHKFNVDEIILKRLITKNNEIEFKGKTFQIKLQNKEKTIELLYIILISHFDEEIFKIILKNFNELFCYLLYSLQVYKRITPKVYSPFGMNIPIYSSNSIKSSIFKDFSISFYIQYDSTVTHLYPKEKHLMFSISDKERNELRFQLIDTSINVSFINKSSVSDVNICRLMSYDTNWHLVVTNYNSQKNIFTTYLDGEHSSNSTFVPIKFKKGSLNIKIGGKSTENIQIFNNKNLKLYGNIGNLSFYKNNIEQVNMGENISLYEIPKDCSFTLMDENKFECYNPLIVNQNIDTYILGSNAIGHILKFLSPQTEKRINYQILTLISYYVNEYSFFEESLLNFIEDQRNFNDSKLFFIIYDLFSKIKVKEKQEKWFSLFIILNIKIWKQYNNFPQILHFLSNEMISQNQHILKEKSFFNDLLIQIQTIDKKYWDKFSLLIKRIAFVNFDQFSFDSFAKNLNKSVEKFPIIIQNNKKSNRPTLINRIPLSNFDNINSFIPRSEISFMNISNFISNKINEIDYCKENQKLVLSDFTIFLIDLIKDISKVIKSFNNNSEFVSLLFKFLAFPNVKVIYNIVVSICIITEKDFHKCVFRILKNIPRYLYYDVLKLLLPEIKKCPYLLSLICALVFFEAPKSIELIEYSTFDAILGSSDGFWYFFPIILVFFLENNFQKTILQFVAFCCGSNVKTIQNILNLMAYFSTIFLCEFNSDIITYFYSVVLEFGQKPKSQLYKNVFNTLFFTLYDKNPNSLYFHTIDDILEFLKTDISSINVKYYLAVSNNKIMKETLVSLIDSNICKNNKSLSKTYTYLKEFKRENKEKKIVNIHAFEEMTEHFYSIQNKYLDHFKESIKSQFAAMLKDYYSWE